MLLEFWQNYGIYFAGCAGSALLLSFLVLFVAIQQVRKICLPENLSLTETLQEVPILLVIGLDLLDLALDVFSVPFVWVILNYCGLKALRNVSAVEALIPFTGPIPTLTIAWLAVRYLKMRF